MGPLPTEARQRIRKAAQVQNSEKDPKAREKAIDEAVAWARRNYPEFFRARYPTR